LSEIIRLQTTIDKEEYQKYQISREKLLSMYRKMLLIRKFEEKIEELYLVKGVLMGPAHLYNGMEAISVGISEGLIDGDLVISNHRGHGHALSLGIDPYRVMSEMFGNSEGIEKGLAGSMHVSIEPSKGALYSSAIVGSQVPIAVGAAYSLKYYGKHNLVVVFFGDGAVTTGSFLEGLAMGSFLKVPLFLVCEDNHYAEYTDINYTVGQSKISKIISSFGIPTVEVDGNDPLAVLKAFKMYEVEVRNWNGPVAIHAYTYRFGGHSVTDSANYRSKEEVKSWKQRDPILRFKERLLSEGIASEEELNKVNTEIENYINEISEKAAAVKPLDFNEVLKIAGDP
jgi:pyruvate dehydrogenase E1 component alpha subunit